MKKLSLILSYFFFLILTASFFVANEKLDIIFAQEPIPELKLPCEEQRDNEFHSTRPYQAAPCGEAPQALFCSNKLVIFENFELENKCKEAISDCVNCFTTCKPNFQVKPHNLNITLDISEFPIMGNTEDDFDDATKLNEYVSWYLNGVVDKKENKNPTNEQIVNFSGPVRKLIPAMIQDQQRIKTIESSLRVTSYRDSETGEKIAEKENHDQIVVNNERLSDWNNDLSFLRGLTNDISELIDNMGSFAAGMMFSNLLSGDTTNLNFTNGAWNKRTPPLPWDDGTVVEDYENPDATPKPKVPFKSNILYHKAYNEWLGKSCIILPVFGLICFDNPLITNKYADLWNFVPLSNNTDKGGKNYILTADGPSYVESKGTKIENAEHTTHRNAPLYLAHTQEVKDLSDLLVKTYQPSEYESIYLSESVEEINRGTDISPNGVEGPPKDPNAPNPPLERPSASLDPYDYLDCSALNVRVNQGDNIFPGDRPDGKEIYVEGVEYLITEVECHVQNIQEWDPNGCINTVTGLPRGCMKTKTDFTCPAQVGIEFKTGTKTPYADEIFANTVSESGSTFRKIFPKVEEGAPVECIADMPTTTNVTYSIDNPLNEAPNDGKQEFKQTKYPADGTGGTQLTFPHIGSVYEYFLNGIQTALRPKGYGKPIANGNCNPSETMTCGDWEDKLEKSSGGICGICTDELGDLAKRILATAGKAYNVPAANIWAAMKHEGADGYQGTTYDFSDENVRKWSTPEQCGGEPMPGCDNSVESTQPPFGFLSKWFYLGDGNNALWSAVQTIDPSRDSKEKVSRCNFLDAAYAAAKLLNQSASNTTAGLSCGPYSGFTTTSPGTCSSAFWTDTKVAQSHNGYAGFCVNDLVAPLYTLETAVSWYKDASCQ